MKTLGMFVKYWESGRVKTRLANSVGDRQASDVYRAFVLSLVSRLGVERSIDNRVFCFSPTDRRDDFAASISPDWQLVPQSDGDLGARMKHFFEQHLRDENDRVVLIGSDSPTIPVEIITDAFEALNHSPVVLGPTSDGGYFLVGASHRAPPIFEGVSWSTSNVWQQTVDLLARHNVPFVELPPWYDVDEIDDLRRLDRELQELIVGDPIWNDLASEVTKCLRNCDNPTA